MFYFLLMAAKLSKFCCFQGRLYFRMEFYLINGLVVLPPYSSLEKLAEFESSWKHFEGQRILEEH